MARSKEERKMDIFELDGLVAKRNQLNKPYLEFLRVPSLSLGLYVLSAGAPDPQLPHADDEVYYIISGRGSLQVGNESRPVGPGTVAFVEATVEHRFHEITEDLTILVFYALAEQRPT
jgi:mannose-6-phosphate isomerase-like protein (cupin superfamily)